MDTAVRKTRKATEQQRVTIAVRPAAGPGILPALLAGAQGPDGVLTDVVFTYDEIGALRDGTADVALMCQTAATPGLELMESARSGRSSCSRRATPWPTVRS